MKTLLRKNDIVVCIAGRSSGKQGKILELKRGDGRALVEGLNMIKRHMRKSQLHPQGAIVEKEAPLQLANLMLFCPTCNKGVRLGLKRDGDKRLRFCRKCQHEFDKK
ncbi:MAG: 50S ribosomal protein L24 [Verrucomicrobia bacterium]|nr:50S ribosomal protein L24 [Verrucomicrobiota bacterium]